MNRIEERARIEKLIGPLKDASGYERRSFSRGRCASMGRVVATASPPPPPEPMPEEDSFSTELAYLLLGGREGLRTLRARLAQEIGKFESERDQRMADIRNNRGLTEGQIRHKQNTLKAEAAASMRHRLGPCVPCAR